MFRMREEKGYVRITGTAENEYRPSEPPMGPSTVSCFTMCTLFDVRLGSSRGTMGNCNVCITREFDCSYWLFDTAERMRR